MYIIQFMWSAVLVLLQCNWNPACFSDLYRELRGHVGQSKRVLWTCCAALVWSLWTTRNKFTIDGVFPTQFADILYKLSMYLQVWKPVAWRQDREAMELTISRIRQLYAQVREAVVP